MDCEYTPLGEREDRETVADGWLECVCPVPNDCEGCVEYVCPVPIDCEGCDDAPEGAKECEYPLPVGCIECEDPLPESGVDCENPVPVR